MLKDLEEAITAHSRWKDKFRQAILNRESMDEEVIARDDCCKLGKWLHGEGRTKWSTKPEFARLVEDHRFFHIQAGKLSHIVNEQQYAEAESILLDGMAFRHASTSVVTSIRALKASLLKDIHGT